MPAPFIIFGKHVARDFHRYFNAHVAADGLEILNRDIGKFPSGEPFCELKLKDGVSEGAEKPLGGRDVIVVQSLEYPFADSLTDLLLLIYTLKDYGAGRIILDIPFLGFARQDRGFDGRLTSVAFKHIAAMLKTAAGDDAALITQELHSKAGEKFLTDIFGADNVTFLRSTALFVRHLAAAQERLPLAIGPPDGGEIHRRQDAAQLRAGAVAIDLNIHRRFYISKVHDGLKGTKVVDFEGDVTGCKAIEIDDMADTCGTLINGGITLKEKGAVFVEACVTHPILTGQSLKRLLLAKTADGRAAIDRLTVVNTIAGMEDKIAALCDVSLLRRAWESVRCMVGLPNAAYVSPAAVKQRVTVLDCAPDHYQAARSYLNLTSE